MECSQARGLVLFWTILLVKKCSFGSALHTAPRQCNVSHLGCEHCSGQALYWLINVWRGYVYLFLCRKRPSVQFSTEWHFNVSKWSPFFKWLFTVHRIYICHVSNAGKLTKLSQHLRFILKIDKKIDLIWYRSDGSPADKAPYAHTWICFSAQTEKPPPKK